MVCDLKIDLTVRVDMGHNVGKTSLVSILPFKKRLTQIGSVGGYFWSFTTS